MCLENQFKHLLCQFGATSPEQNSEWSVQPNAAIDLAPSTHECFECWLTLWLPSYQPTPKNKYVFMIDNKNYLFITKNCNKKCSAYKVLNKVSTKKVFTRQGQNPGAILCDEILRKEVVTLRNELGGESTFCRFKDGSMIESSRLFIHAQINDEKRKTR